MAQKLLDSVPVRFVIVDKTIGFVYKYTRLLRNAADNWYLAYAVGNNGVGIYERMNRWITDKADPVKYRDMRKMGQ